jgi:hypothetical protein
MNPSLFNEFSTIAMKSAMLGIGKVNVLSTMSRDNFTLLEE